MSWVTCQVSLVTSHTSHVIFNFFQRKLCSYLVEGLSSTTRFSLTTFIHFQPLKFTFIPFYPLSSSFIHFHPFSSIFFHFHPLLSTFILCHPLLSVFIHFHLFSPCYIHIHPPYLYTTYLCFNISEKRHMKVPD